MGEISGPKKIGEPRRICDQGTGSGPSFVQRAIVNDIVDEIVSVAGPVERW